MLNNIGVCSICKQEGKLSDDHIPPKSCGNNGRSLYISFTPEYLQSGSIKKQKISQNGLKFRTICPRCNNELGAKYDKDLFLFRQFILSIISNSKIDMKYNELNVIKGILGHLLAASELDESIPANDIRKFYFDDNLNCMKEFLSKYSLLCFYYPYRESIFILKNYVPIDFSGQDKIPEGMISSFYFYPFAFVFCDKTTKFPSKDLLNLLLGGNVIFSAKDWVYPNGDIRPETWPALVDNNGHAFVASGLSKDSVFKK